MCDLIHLTSSARDIAKLPDEERRMRIHSERWIGYGRAKEVLTKLEGLLKHPVIDRMPNALLIGETNNGKSMIVRKFLRSNQRLASGPDNEERRILAMQMPSKPDPLRFYSLLLTNAAAPFRHGARVAELETLAIKVLRGLEVRMLVIDEIHNVLSGSRTLQSEFLNLIRFLGNELKIVMVGVGTKDAYLAIRSDPQLENRFLPLILPSWEEDGETRSLLASFGQILPLRHPSDITNTAIVRYVLAKAEGTIGEIASLLRAAATAAIDTGHEAINQITLELADYESPSERRRRYQREAA